MKSVLISINKPHTDNIKALIKRIEVRKNKPNCALPFLAYIYETKNKGGCGKVIGEFVCDRISGGAGEYAVYHTEGTCLTPTEIADYIGDKYAYYWHITDLVIYDKPRDLSEFKTICRNAYCQDYWGDPTWFCKDGYSSCAVTDKEREFPYNEECIYFDCPSVGGESCEYEDYAYCNCNGLKPLTRPPQSWCYVESEDKE